MTRPTPRRSSLAGSSPITSPPAEPAAVDATGWTKDQHDEADQAEQMREMRAVEAEQAARRPQPKRKYPAKVSFYQERADTDRIRNYVDTVNPRSMAVVGAGFIGLEMADFFNAMRFELWMDNGMAIPASAQALQQRLDALGKAITAYEKDLQQYRDAVVAGERVRALELGARHRGALGRASGQSRSGADRRARQRRLSPDRSADRFPPWPIHRAGARDPGRCDHCPPELASGL